MKRILLALILLMSLSLTLSACNAAGSGEAIAPSAPSESNKLPDISGENKEPDSPPPEQSGGIESSAASSPSLGDMVDIWENDTKYTVGIGEIGKDGNGNTTVEVTGINLVGVEISKFSIPVKVDIICGGETFSATVGTLRDNAVAFSFDTDKSPDKIILRPVDSSNLENHVTTFEAGTKAIISSEAVSFSEPVTSSVSQDSKPQASMTASSSGISGGILTDEYGIRGSQQKDGIPTLSPPISIKDAPDGTTCYAIMMLDPDSKPLCGFEWVHWLAANIEKSELSKNASIDLADNMVQGANDFGTTGYGGPTPPDKPHTYKITIYALDTKLELKNGYSKDELVKAMDGHVLAEAVLSAKYSN